MLIRLLDRIGFWNWLSICYYIFFLSSFLAKCRFIDAMNTRDSIGSRVICVNDD